MILSTLLPAAVANGTPIADAPTSAICVVVGTPARPSANNPSDATSDAIAADMVAT